MQRSPTILVIDHDQPLRTILTFSLEEIC